MIRENYRHRNLANLLLLFSVSVWVWMFEQGHNHKIRSRVVYVFIEQLKNAYYLSS